MSLERTEPGARSHAEVFGRSFTDANAVSLSYSSRRSSFTASDFAPAKPSDAMRGVLIASAMAVPIWGALYLLLR